MASFKASHPKRHDLTLARTGGEGRSLDVRAHPKGPWRRVVKKWKPSSYGLCACAYDLVDMSEGGGGVGLAHNMIPCVTINVYLE